VSTTTTTPEDVQRTLQGYLNAATTTGQLRGTKVELTADGVTWVDAVILAEGEHPVAARATVYREGWQIPTVITELWDEVVPADDDWLRLWEVRPNVLFGAHVLRTALRRTFADVLGDRREPDDLPTGTPAPEAAPESWDIDWAPAIAAVDTTEDLDALHKRMRTARAVTPALEVQLIQRRGELAGAPAQPAQRPAPVRPVRAPRPAPQDHLPGNRAERRARKKGRH